MREGRSNRAWEGRTLQSFLRPRNAGLWRVFSQDPRQDRVTLGEPV
jgi:hypothetical protein